jgi:phospholipid/cholesterol/gamma-HCH transport system substrate-binding protein
MAKQINKTVIGGFVVSVIVMLIGSVIILGGGKMFKKTVKYVMFFEKSVKGLSVGAPVVFNGVEIGSVSNVIINYDIDKAEVDIPVIIELDPSLMKMKGKISATQKQQRQRLARLIELGFRAQLTLQSIVTGQLMVELNFYPDTAVRLTGIKSKYPEIPTITSSIDRIAEKLKKVHLDKIAEKLIDVLDNIDNVTGNPKIEDIIDNGHVASKNLKQLILDADKMVADVDVRVKKVLDNLVVASGDAHKFLVDAQQLVKDTDSQVQPMSDKVQDAMVSVKGAMDQAKTTLAGINNYVGQNSDTRHKLNRALDEIGGAARSLNSLMDYLERHPEALLKGKSGRGGS